LDIVDSRVLLPISDCLASVELVGRAIAIVLVELDKETARKAAVEANSGP